MCGLPHHAANGYIARILKSGRKVAICDQMEDARPGQLTKREVTQILSPGTHFDERMLVAERNNFLAAVYPSGKNFGLALVDLTTGDFLTTELENDSALLAELERLRPAEIIFPTEATTLRDLLRGAFQILSGYDDWTFAPETAFFTVKEQFKVASLDGFWIESTKPPPLARRVARCIISCKICAATVKHLTRISFLSSAAIFSRSTRPRCGISEILRTGQAITTPRATPRFTARSTKPSRRWGRGCCANGFSQPLARAEPIRQRQDAVQTFIEQFLRPRRVPPTACESARFGTHAWPFKFRQRQCARFGRAANSVRTNSCALKQILLHR